MNASNRISLSAAMILLGWACSGAEPDSSYKVDDATRQRVQTLLKTDATAGKLQFPNPSPDAQWFPEAGFGLFMHWGIYSVEGLNPSWSMRADRVEDREARIKAYYANAGKFNPRNYDPDKWLAAAKRAGFTYAVLTTKHHDGYALWPSKVGNMSTRTHMGGRDLIKPYVEACRKNGLKVGFYFSPRDWHYPGFAGFGGGNTTYDVYIKGGQAPPMDRALNQAAFEEFYAYSIAQLHELLTGYGKVDLVWFDGVRWPQADIHTSATVRWMRSLQPGAVISNNWDDRVPPALGDYRYLRPPGPNEGITWWEVPACWKGNWGWSPDAPIKPTAWVLTQLVTIRSRGGNFLLDMGPAPDGTMPAEFYAACDELAAWMKHSGESVIGASKGPAGSTTNTPITIRGKTWYLHGLPDDVESKEFTPRDKEIKVAGVGKPASVTLLRTGETLEYQLSDGGLRVVIPANKRTRLVDVVAVRW